MSRLRAWLLFHFRSGRCVWRCIKYHGPEAHRGFRANECPYMREFARLDHDYYTEAR